MLTSKPTVAAIEGYAVAGGLELSLWCDLRVMEDTAILGVYCRRFAASLRSSVQVQGDFLAAIRNLRIISTEFPLYRFGVPLIDGGTIRLPQLIGLGRALDLIMTGMTQEASIFSPDY